MSYGANISERRRILKKLDVKRARFVAKRDDIPIPDSDRLVLAALHKARYMSPDFFNRKERRASKKWLIAEGFGKEVQKDPRQSHRPGSSALQGGIEEKTVAEF